MKILSLFTKTREEKETKQATRIAKSLARGQEALIDGLEARRDSAVERMETLVEGKISAINTNSFNQVYHDAQVEIGVIDAELKIAKKTQKELFTAGK